MVDEPDAPVAGALGNDGADRISALLSAWQESADQERLESLVTAVRPLVEAVAGQTLAGCHVADRSAT